MEGFWVLLVIPFLQGCPGFLRNKVLEAWRDSYQPSNLVFTEHPKMVQGIS